jgi:hypothetical protein
LAIWKSAGYGQVGFKDWARSAGAADCSEDPDTPRTAPDLPCPSRLIEDVVRDAISYVKLVERWNIYVGAIERLTPVHAYWLFRRTEN